ncbi:MAG: YlbE-like family protein [Bacilli bacterium]|nr:YlbE-like family protein [Bacilli bacterium]MDD4809318.1 YlbE-like family protein [Bacilli bacterium]
MTLELQYQLKSNPLYIKYLRENSYWYKLLNRNPQLFNNFVEEVKTNYRLRPSDRISRALEYVDMFQTIISSLK